MELSKYFGFFALVLMSSIRLFHAYMIKLNQSDSLLMVAACYIYPMISLKIHSRLVRFVLVLLSQISLDKFIIPKFGQQNDYFLTILFCFIIFATNEIVPFLGFENKKKLAKEKLLKSEANKKEEDKWADNRGDTHILYFIFFSSIVFALFLSVLNFFQINFTPYTCSFSNNCDQKEKGQNIENQEMQFCCMNNGEIQIPILSIVQKTVGHLFLFIFLIGPIQVYLKIKEGKTSITKIVEDYEDERYDFIKGRIPDNKMDRGLLPTTTKPNIRANAQKNVETEDLM